MNTEWRKPDTSAHPLTRLPNEDQTRSNTENFLVCPVELRNQPGVLLKIPSLSWLETTKNHTRKDGAETGLSSGDHESSATTQQGAQTMSDGYKDGYFLTQPSFLNWGKTRKGATTFLVFPTDFSGMYTYQRELDEKRARSRTYRSRESDGTGGICVLPSDWYRNSHQFPSSKKKTARWRCEKF